MVKESRLCPPSGAKSLLADDHLAQQDLAFLAVLDFLCECGSVQPVHGLLFKPQEVRRRLLLLLEQIDFSKALHLNMVGSSCREEVWLLLVLVVQLMNINIWISFSILSCWRSFLLRTRSLQRNSIRCFALWRRESFCDCFNAFHIICAANNSLFVVRCLQGPVFSVPSGPRDLCCCSAGFVTLHQEPGENPPRAGGNETRSGISAKSGVWILVSGTFLQREQLQGWSEGDYVNLVLK